MMLRRIVGFHQDEKGDWVAELDCLHGQHVRHKPPFQQRPWVLRAAGRAERLGTQIDCPLCDRAELPAGLQVLRSSGPFDEHTVPSGLLRDHLVPAKTWGCLHVLEGSLRFSMATDPSIDRLLHAGDSQPIPPQVPHAVAVDGPVRFCVDLLGR